MTDTQQAESNFVSQFSPFWQEAVVGYMMSDPVFFLACKTFIKYEWFENPVVAGIAKYMYDFFDKYKRSIRSWKEIDGMVRIIHTDIPNQTKYAIQIQSCIKATDSIGLDVLRTQMTLWIKIAKFKNGILEATRIFNQKRHEEAAEWLSRATQEISLATFDADDTVSFLDPVSFFQRQKEERKFCCTIGHPDLDELLFSSSKIKNPNIPRTSNGRATEDLKYLTTGSLFPGESTIILGGSNVGKTSSIITIVAANVMFGKHVLLITHEQKDTDIKERIYQSVMGSTREMLDFVGINPDTTAAAEAASRMLHEYLVFAPHIRSGQMTAEDVVAKILKINSNLKAKINKGFDLIVDDYPGVLKSKEYSNKKTEAWDERRNVYFQLMTCMKEIGAHGVFPVQTNREGFKQGRNRDGKFVDLDGTSGAFGITCDASNVISLNRSEKDRQENTMVFYVAKCRQAMNGYAYLTKIDLPICRTHHPSLKGTTLSPGETACDAALSLLAAECRAAESTKIFADQYEMYPTLKRWPFEIDWKMAVAGKPIYDIISNEDLPWIEQLLEPGEDSEEVDSINITGDFTCLTFDR